jgi:REP element-mobilizing transposase RayT
MPIPIRYRACFIEDQYYHVFNRTNNKEILFLSDENRHFFLARFEKHLSLYLDTVCWTLLNNHFHFFVKVRAQADIVDSLSKITKPHSSDQMRYLAGELSINTVLQKSFKRFFQSYAQSFNRENNRSGNLFRRPFRRVSIFNESYYTAIIIYIHTNAWKHGLCSDFTKYEWSSYQSFLRETNINVIQQEVIEWFGGTEKFASVHQNAAPIYKNLGL